jgi:hypothetical protein
MRQTDVGNGKKGRKVSEVHYVHCRRPSPYRTGLAGNGLRTVILRPVLMLYYGRAVPVLRYSLQRVTLDIKNKKSVEEKK